MTDPGVARRAIPVSDEWASGADSYSKDYWDLVFEQLARRRLFKVGLAVLALLYATAIYAPLIANDRPFVLEAIDYRSYKAALRSLSPVSASLAGLLERTPQEYAQSRRPDSPATLRDALELERQAAAGRVQTLGTYLPAESRAPLVELMELVDDALAARAAGEAEDAVRLGDEARERTRALRTDLKPLDPLKPEQGGLALVGAKSFPLLDAISHWEVFFMVLWAAVLTWPLWNRLINRRLLGGDRERIRRWRRRKLVGVLGLSALGATVWSATVGGQSATFDVAPFKGALTSGEIAPTSEPVFALLPFGYAETHLTENFRPPTWRRDARLDDDGHYVSGFRRPKADPVTGYVPPATPVEVRQAEPGVNSPWRHLAGTDELGRDFFVRMIWGGRVSLAVGILSAVLLTLIGVVVGSLAGYFGGWVDMLVMRVIEILQSIPAFFLILMTMAFTDPNVVPPIIAIVVVIALIRWTGAARLVRGEFLRLREQEFVISSRALGFSSLRTIFRHILPNAMSPVLVNAAFDVAAGILIESAVSYLGFGIQHPGASWGSLVNESKSADHWWIQVFPGVLIFLTVTCYNLVGDAVRDALDPKMKV